MNLVPLKYKYLCFAGCSCGQCPYCGFVFCLRCESILTEKEFQRGSKSNELVLQISIDVPAETKLTVMDMTTGHTAEVQHLGYIELHCRLHDEYPNDDLPPSVDIKCNWLPEKKLMVLSDLLLEYWQQERESGEVVLFQWYQLLKDQALDKLGIQEKLEVHESSAFDLIIAHDKEARRLDFWQCQICFEELQGCQFEELRDCGHVYCSTCLGSHCRARIEDGQMTSMICPEPECDEALPGDVVQR